MKIEQSDSEKKGTFKAMDDTVVAGELVYTWAGKDKFIIEHTEVDDAYAGRGIGKQLVMKAVEFARTQKVKILPLCPYAKALFDKLPEIHDVLF
jgi:uncharacterized protein